MSLCWQTFASSKTAYDKTPGRPGVFVGRWLDAVSVVRQLASFSEWPLVGRFRAERTQTVDIHQTEFMGSRP